MAVLVLFCPRLVLFPLRVGLVLGMYLFKELTSDCVCVCGELVCRSEVLEPAWTLLSCPGRGEPLPEGRALPAPSSPRFWICPRLYLRDGRRRARVN